MPYWDISPQLRSAVYIGMLCHSHIFLTSLDGELNNPRIGTRFWSLEIGIPLSEYVK